MAYHGTELDEELKTHQTRFGKLGQRIERKRQEIQSLSDGASALRFLFAAMINAKSANH
jgi:hypothetical protein